MILKAIYYLKMCNIKEVNLLSIKKPPKKNPPQFDLFNLALVKLSIKHDYIKVYTWHMGLLS